MSDTLSGFLCWTEWEAVREALARAGRITYQGDGQDGWRGYSYSVDEEIPWVENDGDPPYVYHLLIRGGVDRLIVLSNNYRICDHFLDKDLRPIMHAPLRKADIGVHELVLAFADYRKPKAEGPPLQSDSLKEYKGEPRAEDTEWSSFNAIYTLGYAVARSDAFGGNLQRVEFEGEDLAMVPLFTDAIPFVRFRNCGVRRRAWDDRGYPSSYELLRLGKAGFLSFSTPGSVKGQRDRFRDVEALLRSLNRLGFIR